MDDRTGPATTGEDAATAGAMGDTVGAVVPQEMDKDDDARGHHANSEEAHVADGNGSLRTSMNGGTGHGQSPAVPAEMQPARGHEAFTGTGADTVAGVTTAASVTPEKTVTSVGKSTSGGSSPAPAEGLVEAQSSERTGSVSSERVSTPPHFVAPSSYLRPLQSRGPGSSGSASGLRPGSSKDKRMMTPVDREQIEGLRAIRAFLKVRTSYDVLPLSYRLIIFDTSLLVKKSLNILTQSGIVSAPLWDSKTSTFAGLLTTSDYLNVVQYYWQYPDALAQVDQFRLNSLREIERAIGVAPIETVSINPHRPLYEACRRMLESRARRIPLVDFDDETQREMVVSVVTQYRILKFVSVNVKETQMLRKPLRELRIGTYDDLLTATMDTPVMDVIHMLVQRSISSVPILDAKDGTLLNVFEAVDVIALIKGGDYDNLNLTVGKALEKRSE
ncbi:hypothetical protein M433DRAFT_153217, partial [Acidomyces richmondensis BFW]